MKIVVTSDLHYDIARGVDPTRRLADEICGLSVDALILLGDVAGRDVDIVDACLHLFDGFAGRKFFVAGNHELWVRPGESSLYRLEELLPAICREAGFWPLDVESANVDGVGFVGTVGWYDYSFRSEWLGLPLRFYEHKIAPGAAARVEGFGHLLAHTADIPEEAFSYGVRWMDGAHVDLGMSDAAFCEYLLARFRRHLATEAARSRRIVAAMHHVPFIELVPTSQDPTFAFATAFMGSARFGEAVLAEPKVQYVLCGHSHRAMGVRKGHLTCLNVGCTYVQKRYDILEV